MAKLLSASDDPGFGWYPTWIKLNASRQPKNRIKEGMSHPPTIKIPWSSHNWCEMSCDVNPDKALFGSKHVLAYTIPDYETKLLVHWDKEQTGDKNYVKKSLTCSAAVYKK